MANIYIKSSFAGGLPLAKMGEILAQRMKYLNETARDSVAACALNVLRSIRTITRVAKPSKVKVSVAPNNSLYCSYYKRGASNIPCVRVKGSKARYVGDERIRWVQTPTPGMDKIWKVYYFEDDHAKDGKGRYLICSPNLALAKQYAKRIVAGRAVCFAGLAKAALSALMKKTFSKSPIETVSPRVNLKAQQVTIKRELVSKNGQSEGGTYTLTLRDDLRYAIQAIRGGRGAIDTQMKKAMNKLVSVINRKLPDGETFFGPRKIPTPFPEVRQNRR